MNKIIFCVIAIVLFSCESGTTHSAQESVPSSLVLDNPVRKDSLQEQVSSIDGYFIGVEEMCLIDEKGKKHCYGENEDGHSKWYRRRAVTIEGGSVHVVDSPIRIIGRDTLYSASDGGFYFYSGALKKIDTVYTAEITLYESLYALPEKTRNPKTGEEEEVLTKVWQMKQSGNDLLINGLLYKRSIDELKRMKVRARAERPVKSKVINPRFPLKNILGTWSSELGYTPKFVINEKVYYLVGDGEAGGALYMIENDSIRLFYNDDIMSRGRIKEATGKQLIIEWEGGNESKYERYR